MSIDRRIELFGAVCDAVQHAHQRGVIHRDLKPSNILVREVDGAPQPVVIDFGIAKAVRQDAVERSLLTVQDAAVGTPDYMSPEQADSGGVDVDTRSDIFSLGVLLYELLVGVRPYPNVQAGLSGWERHRRRLHEESPPRPSARVGHRDEAIVRNLEERGESPHALSRRLRRDLDWIVLRCLERDRERRYASASDLANDLRRHLRDQPVEARPPDHLYRLGKLVQRHRLAFAAAVIVGLALVTGGAVATIGMIRARTAERAAVAAREEAEREAVASAELADFMIGLFEVTDPGQARGNSVTAREILDRGVEQVRTELDDQPVVQARLMHTMGTVYVQLGLYPEAQELLEKALELRRTELGPDSPEAATTLLNLGMVQRRRVEREQARVSYEEALRIRESAFGPDSPEVAEVLRQLAAVERQTGEVDRAIERLERALEISEKHHGPDHPETASVLNNLAVAAYQAGDYARARENLDKSLAIIKAEHGSDHPDIGVLLNNLGMIARRQGDNRGAAGYIERDIELSRKVLGSDHPEVANALRNLGFARMALGEYDSAQLAFEESLEIRKRAIGPETILTADAHVGLGELAVRRGDYEEAGTRIDRALAIYDDVAKAEHDMGRVRILESRARIARLVGDHAGATMWCRTAIRVASTLNVPDAEAARCRLQIAMMAWLGGEQSGARAAYDEVTADLPTDRVTFLDTAYDTTSRSAFLGLTGDLDEAFWLLELGVEAGRIEAWIAVNPDLEPLHSDPRWAVFVDQLRDRLNPPG
jgi:non-specific serine/threonine protein kinase/serine/threonine-protein kinase